MVITLGCLNRSPNEKCFRGVSVCPLIEQCGTDSLGRLKSHPEPRGLRNFCISPAAMDEAEDLYLDFVIE